MFEIPENIIQYFFEQIHERGKYNVVVEDGFIKIKPSFNQDYYKPVIIISNLDRLQKSLTNYVLAINEFYTKYNNLDDYHDLSYFFNNLFLNMTVSDAQDFASYVDRRTFFFGNTQFREYNQQTLLQKEGNIEYYVEHCLEFPGLESPFILVFKMKVEGEEYPLPLVRCAFDENNVCHLFAIQFGKGRSDVVSDESYRKIVNSINSGVNKYRNVSPSFVITFKLFLLLLEKYNITQIKIPDFLFGRYKNYYNAQTTNRSDAILTRILDKFLLLIQRMEYQFEGFSITSYPNEVDSYTTIKLSDKISDKRKIKKK